VPRDTFFVGLDYLKKRPTHGIKLVKYFTTFNNTIT
jgi:hypothetical protein